MNNRSLAIHLPRTRIALPIRDDGREPVAAKRLPDAAPANENKAGAQSPPPFFRRPGIIVALMIAVPAIQLLRRG